MEQIEATSSTVTVRPVAVTLEVARLALLFRQNVQGVLGLLLYAVAYVVVCGETMGTALVLTWLSIVVVSCVLRLIASWLWSKRRDRVKTLAETRPWHIFLQSMLFISGAAWGFVGWIMRDQQVPELQIFVALTVVFIVAGSFVLWSISPRAMFIVVLPASIPWIVGQLISERPEAILMGVLCAVYLVLGSKVGMSLHRYVEDSLKINTENAHLNQVLQKEIQVKAQAEESLRLALSSSNAMEWSWDVGRDVFICKGDLSRSLGLETRYFSGTRADFLGLLHAEDRAAFLAQTQNLVDHDGDLDAEVRVRWGDGKLRTLVFRGKAQSETESGDTYVTGIAWDATAQKIQVRIQQERDIHEAANRAKSMFLANASHEIRTPLAAISGFVEALLQALEASSDGSANQKQMRSDLLAINRNSKHLISLVNDFLDLSKLETGRLYTQRSTMSLQGEIAESILMVQSAIGAKNLELKLEYESSVPASVELDALRFRQIIVNLLSNAIKFTEAGSITLRIGYRGGHRTNEGGVAEGILTVRVADTGIGMDEFTMSHLFEPFVRGSSEEVQRVSGSGLGLTLSRNLARLLGGDLRLISSSPAVGSEFELTVSTGVEKSFQVPKRGLVRGKSRVSHRRSPPELASEASATKKRQLNRQSNRQLQDSVILVVDDDEDLRDLMKRFLERQGAAVETARNGQAAVDKAAKNSYDVILMDMKMPIMDGYQATTTLREVGYVKPIIALTAYANTDDKQRSLVAGCDNYLSKPVDFDFMLETIWSYTTQTVPFSSRANDFSSGAREVGLDG